MLKPILLVTALFSLSMAQANQSTQTQSLWTCKHLDNNTFPMTTYAYSATSACPPPPHSSSPWDPLRHAHNGKTSKLGFSDVKKDGQIQVIPPEPECVIHAFPPVE